MSHGRFFFAGLVVLMAAGALVRGQQADAPKSASFLVEWAEADHPSGIYHVKGEAKLTILATNASREAAELSGEILFGSTSSGSFKLISVTPVARAMVGSGRQVRVPVQVTFAGVGAYELRLRIGGEGGREMLIGGPERRPLHCILAPRAPEKENGWIAFLPAGAARTRGLIADYGGHTSVRRFLVDEQFLYDTKANIGLGFGASMGASAKDVDAFLEEAAKAKVKLTLRVAVPLQVSPEVVVESINAFRKYVDDAVKRSKGALAGIVISPVVAGGAGGESLSDAQRSLFRSYYIAGYEAAHKADKNVQVLGPGSAALAAEVFRGDGKLTYLDALAISDAAIEPLIAASFLGDRKLALQVLPRAVGDSVPAAAALAARATVVPIPSPVADNGVTAHLLGGATFKERLRLALPSKDPAKPYQTSVPFIAVFQGEGYSVAAIAGFGAGSDLDGLYPSLARGTARVSAPAGALEPDYPNLDVQDDTRAMRVVDGQGSPVECRQGGGGDHLFVPAGDRVVYLLEANTAEELAGSLRSSVPKQLPLFEIRAEQKGTTLKVRLKNISAAAQTGKVQVMQGLVGNGEAVGNLELKALLPGEEEAFEMAVEVGDGVVPYVVEVETGGTKRVTQRSAVVAGIVSPR